MNGFDLCTIKWWLNVLVHAHTCSCWMWSRAVHAYELDKAFGLHNMKPEQCYSMATENKIGEKIAYNFIRKTVWKQKNRMKFIYQIMAMKQTASEMNAGMEIGENVSMWIVVSSFYSPMRFRPLLFFRNEWRAILATPKHTEQKLWLSMIEWRLNRHKISSVYVSYKL